MCLLTVFPMPDLLDSATIRRLENGAAINGDGSGYAVVVGNRIETGKSLDPAEAIEMFAEAYASATGPALFHSRWSTHGVEDLSNVHPFPVGGMSRTVVAHNGILPQAAWPAKGDPRSDTRIFADRMLGKRWGRLDSRKVRDNLRHWLGSNKIAVLTTNRRFARQLYIVGQELGDWVDGVWYSNSDYDGTYARHYRVAGGWTSDADGPTTCDFCGVPAVSVWGICQACHTCQDCYEVASDCQCYISTGTNDSASAPGWPTVVGGTGQTKELVRWSDGLHGLGSGDDAR